MKDEDRRWCYFKKDSSTLFYRFLSSLSWIQTACTTMAERGGVAALRKRTATGAASKRVAPPSSVGSSPPSHGSRWRVPRRSNAVADSRLILFRLIA
jgi:hypothetical protein